MKTKLSHSGHKTIEIDADGNIVIESLIVYEDKRIILHGVEIAALIDFLKLHGLVPIE